jgi:hypothetical protein
MLSTPRERLSPCPSWASFNRKPEDRASCVEGAIHVTALQTAAVTGFRYQPLRRCAAPLAAAKIIGPENPQIPPRLRPAICDACQVIYVQNPLFAGISYISVT